MRYFLDKLASNSPEPGGGSAAALVGALGAALVSMVANLTIGKEKYRDVEKQNAALLAMSEELRVRMQQLIEKDTEAYGTLAMAYKMPRTTDAERAFRSEHIQGALKAACQVPLEISRAALDIAKLSDTAARIGNSAAVSDAGVAALFANACAEAAALNVKTNLKSIKDDKYSSATWIEVQDILKQVQTLKENVSQETYAKIG
jgi:glutamate formiminotransferase/formiminotetrahydrofolate cyclodeaminase